jgi:glycosyltransferase involved in cell wall biosynthesis
MASGVDTHQFHPRPPNPSFESRLPPRPRAIFTGRMHPQKNVDLLIDAWSFIREPATLLLVGEGPERARLQSVARDRNLADRIVFAGAVENVADWLNAADLFVLPSVAEGMSNSLLEAMASGLPSVASAIGGNTDLIENGVTGRLVITQNPSDWSTAMSDLLENPVRRADWGAAARARIDREFSLPVIVDRYIALYDRLRSR